jgi:hypothetical protein
LRDLAQFPLEASSNPSDLALVDDDQGAIAVILDLMYPASPRWRLRDRGRDFELVEAERGRIRLYVAGPPFIGKMSKTQPPRLSINRLVACRMVRRCGPATRPLRTNI